MADGFKLFINTQGKSKDEIKSDIRQLLEQSVKNAAQPSQPLRAKKSDDGKIRETINDIASNSKSEYVYTAQPVPPRSSINNNNITTERKPASYSPSKPVMPNIFSIHQTDADREINAKITEMRSLGEVYYNGYMLKQCAQVSMIKQGEYLAELSDDYDHLAFCGISRPTYVAMSNSQLRTFITWRTKARKGRYDATDEPYVMLYCYELLNKIGVMSAAEAFAKLLEVNEKCGEFAGEMKKLMPRWLKDFYAFNDITAQYPDINEVLKTNCDVHDDEDALRRKDYSGRLSYFMKNSAYDLEKSAFFDEKTRPLLDGAAGAAMSALDGWLDERGIPLFELICGRLKKQYGWEPFKGAFVNLDRMDGFRAVKISEVERYCIKRGEPVLECFEASPYRGFIGYVLKRVEAVVRIQSGYRHKITPNKTMLTNDLCNRERLISAASEPAFDECIDTAVKNWCSAQGIAPPQKARAAQKSEQQSAVPVRVEIDLGKLAQIREESDEIAKRLIIEENGLAEEEIERLSEQIDSDNYSESVTAVGMEEDEVCPQEEEPLFDFSELPAVWRSFAQALREEELAVLAAITRGTAEDVCRSRGLFPEMVYEKINTAALEAVGDIIVENAEIIPDYKREVERIVKLMT